jgi:hypothetical protein
MLSSKSKARLLKILSTSSWRKRDAGGIQKAKYRDLAAYTHKGRLAMLAVAIQVTFSLIGHLIRL